MPDEVTGGPAVAARAALGPTAEGARRRVRMTLEFDGTGFSGWQRQLDGVRTVQGTLEAALAKLPGEHGAVVGAGRTDAGVHATGMVAHLDSTFRVADERFRRALNAHLPADVRVTALRGCDAGFHAQFDCRYRRYLYRLRSARESGAHGLALDRSRVLHVTSPLDTAAMRAAAARFRGAHDFSSLATQETRSRVRTVTLCDLRLEHGELRLHVAADGFLRNMVRAIVGTLLWVGTGRLTPADIDRLLAERDRSAAGPNVGPQGLYFVEAGYEAWDERLSESVIRASWP